MDNPETLATLGTQRHTTKTYKPQTQNTTPPKAVSAPEW